MKTYFLTIKGNTLLVIRAKFWVVLKIIYIFPNIGSGV